MRVWEEVLEKNLTLEIYENGEREVRKPAESPPERVKKKRKGTARGGRKKSGKRGMRHQKKARA